jgi:hypothetical protein
MHRTLPELVKDIRENRGARKSGQLGYEIKMFLWETYDPNDDLIYPVIADWDDLLERTITQTTYNSLSQDEVLSILFGLIHRNRIVEGLWWSMFERGVIQKLLAQLLSEDSDKY